MGVETTTATKIDINNTTRRKYKDKAKGFEKNKKTKQNSTELIDVNRGSNSWCPWIFGHDEAGSAETAKDPLTNQNLTDTRLETVSQRPALQTI